MNCIVIDPETLTLDVTDARHVGNFCFRALPRQGARPDRHRVARRILHDVLYPDMERRLAKAGRKYKCALPPPDPWLLALGVIMWEGIVQGITWDSIKLVVSTALRRMQRAGVAPRKKGRQPGKSKIEVGFTWIEYRNGKKQKEMFLGLKRGYEKKK